MSSADQSANKPKRNPFCSRCRNHGKSAQVKGHKRHCEYRECQCEGCVLVEWRQKISAAQIKRRRYQKQDEECGRKIEITPPRFTSEPPANDSGATAIVIDSTIHNPNSHHSLIPGGNSAAAAAVAAQQAAAHQHQQHQQQQRHHQAQRLQQQQPQTHHHHQHQLHLTTGTQSARTSSQHETPPPMTLTTTNSATQRSPSIAEQIKLVEDLQQFGSLAIFAWLRAENFDFLKLREMIELCRSSFNDLLEYKSKQTISPHHMSLATINALPVQSLIWPNFDIGAAHHHSPHHHLRHHFQAAHHHAPF